MSTYIEFMKRYEETKDTKYKRAWEYYSKIFLQDRDSWLADTIINAFENTSAVSKGVEKENFIKFDWKNPNHKQASQKLFKIPKTGHVDYIVKCINQYGQPQTQVSDGVINEDKNTINFAELESKMAQLVRTETEKMIKAYLVSSTNHIIDEDKIRAIVESIVGGMSLSKTNKVGDKVGDKVELGGIKDFEMSESGEIDLANFDF
jgi:hypothetical protein